MSTDDPRLSKIRALLAQAESTNFPEEAKAFSEAAQRLMTKWMIDDAMLATGKPADSFKVVFIDFPMAYSPYQGPREHLLNVVGKAQSVRVIFTAGKVYRNEDGSPIVNKQGRHSWRNTSKATLCGFESAVQLVQVLYISLLLQAEHEFQTPAVQELMAQQAPKPGNRIRWRNSWLTGYTSEIRKRLQVAKAQTVEAAGASTALVLVDRDKAVDRAVAQQFNRLSTKSSGTNTHYGAMDEGRRAGSRADIGAPKIGSHAGALGSGA